MLEIGSLTPLYLVIAVTELALGIMVYIKGHGSPVNRIFLLLTVLTGIGTFLDMLTFNMSDPDMAVWTTRAFLFVIVLEIGTAYRLCSMVPFDTGMVFLRSGSILYPISIICLAVFLPLTVGEVRQDPQGWVPDPALPSFLLMAILLIYVLLLIITLGRKYSKGKDDDRSYLLILTSALIFPAALMLIISVLSIAGSSIPRAYALGDIISMVMLSYGILRYGLLIVPQVTEEPAPPSRPVPPLVKGRAYLFESPDADRMFESVLQEMGDGASALIISRIHPDQLRARYRLTRTPIIWLAQSPGPDRIFPGNLQMLAHVILGFLSRGPSLIAIEGLEHLMINNEMDKVLMFLGEVRDHAIIEGSIILMTVDPRTLTERQKAILEREFELVFEE